MDLEGIAVESRVRFVAGGNFSGRTDTLRRAMNGACGSGDTPPRAYIGVETYHSISALAATVAGELSVHVGRRWSDQPRIPLADELRLDRILDRNPLTLSGGEQVALSVCSAVSLEPLVLAVDCALEQLSPEWRDRVVQALAMRAKKGTRVLLTDNRIAEWRDEERQSIEIVAPDPPVTIGFPRIDGLVELKGGVQAPELCLDRVAYRYRGATMDVLRDVSCKLEPGVVYHLSGTNGAGKSTLAKLLAGVLKPKAGKTLVAGRPCDLTGCPGRIIGYHFQNPDVQFFCSTVERELRQSASVSEPSVSVQDEILYLAAHAFGLPDVLRRHPAELPFAARKRVALASTMLAANTPWIILDEPTLGQDDENAEQITRLVESLTKLGRGVIIISHSHALAQRLHAVPLILTNGCLCSEDVPFIVEGR